MVHHNWNCKECSEGYTIQKQKEGTLGREVGVCKKNECECEHGEPTEALECPKMGDPMCIKCDDFYHITDDKTRCEQNKCTCENGVPQDFDSGRCTNEKG